MTWWDDQRRARIAKSANPLGGQTPGERAFKRAAVDLIAEGVYPSGRQIRKRLGKDVSGKVSLCGRECHWLAEVREYFSIEPCFSYMRRADRAYWDDVMYERHTDDFLYKLRRGKGGKLVVCPEWVDAELELEDEREKQRRGR